MSTGVTFQAMYLMVGAERVLREKEPGHQTHLELAELLAERAPLAARTRRNLARRQQLPSIFEYEVTEELGGGACREPALRRDRIQHRDAASSRTLHGSKMSQQQQPFATVTFRSPINRETSYNQTNLAEDTESTMDFYVAEGTERRGWIEWDMPELDMGEEIGIWWDENMELSDYDGVFALPAQCIPLLEKYGITVGEDFR